MGSSPPLPRVNDGGPGLIACALLACGQSLRRVSSALGIWRKDYPGADSDS